MARRYTALLMAFLLVFNLTGCGGDNTEASEHEDDKTDMIAIKTDNEAYNIIAEEIDKSIKSLSINYDAYPIAKEFEEADLDEKIAMAMDLADDMAMAQFLGVVTDEMLVMGGNAVKAYPHPLLLNNYATILADIGNASDALFFLLQAAAQDPENPLLLTNIANVYIELDDFGAAERYAKLALSAQNDFGPAYQVLTTVHLKNNDSILAAETMVKSAKHCFNDVTEYHFKAFLYAVDELDPETDEYPLKEEFIKDLYGIASQNVDTRDISSNIDTPGTQIAIKPFPQITGADNLMKSYDYLKEEGLKLARNQGDALDRYAGLEYADEDYLDDLYLDDISNDGVYPVKKNLRQIYAYKVLRSYYIFKLEQCRSKYMNQLLSISEDYMDKYININESHSSTSNSAAAKVKYYQDVLDNSKHFAPSIISTSQAYYNETKQILEEYWLRTGGLLQYINNEEIFEQYNTERELDVYEYLPEALNWLESHALDILSNANNSNIALVELAMEQGTQSSDSVQEDTEQDFDGDDMVPSIEREAFTVYPESSDMGKIGIEEGLFGFDFSMQYDGESYNLQLDTPVYSLQGTKNIYSGHTMAAAMFDVRAEVVYDWLKDSKTIQNKLEKSGKAGKALALIGKLDLGYKNGTNISQYVVMDSNGRVIDRGILYTREKGYEGLGLGRSEKVEVRKSYMTGVAVKRKTTKYKFMFATYETPGK
jgi:hypothetical protein